MALPMIKTLTDCGDFSKTVLPYGDQLYELPQQILQSITNPQGLKEIYVSTNPMISAFAFCLFICPIFLIVSEVNKNYSQVDRLWSLLPTMYNAHFALYAHAAGLPTQRMDTLLALSVIWSTRLTFNYWRKGGYSIGSEDYRWEILRGYTNAFGFFLFNVVFIALAQNILLFSVTFPTYLLLLAAQLTPDSLTLADQASSGALMALVTLAFFADQQQWNYQNAKADYKKTAKVPANFDREDLDRGFVTAGLWSWSRHPNFLAEQSVWVVVYQWSCWVTESYLNWSIVGAIAYLILFQASTLFTESLSSRKYPEYAEYQKRVGKFVPNPFSSLPGDFSDKKSSPSR